jgi:ABC-2 type transport system ATP-binding protein
VVIEREVSTGGASAPAVVQADALVKHFDGVRAVDGLSFSVGRAEIFGLLGPNGAGKTTTIRMIMDILRPDAGSVFVLGLHPSKARERVGYLPEDRGLYAGQKVLETLVYLARLKGRSRAEAETGAREWLERVGLADRADAKVEDLSRGMRQKVQLAASLAHRPELAILDEPFGGLDPVNVEIVKEEIQRLAANGTTVVLSAHQMNLVEALCDRILLVNRGQAVLYGKLADIKRRHAARAVRVKVAGALPPLPGTREIGQRDGTVTLALDDADPGAILAQLVQSGVSVESWEVASAPLEEIFLAAVAGGPVLRAEGPPESPVQASAPGATRP